MTTPAAHSPRSRLTLVVTFLGLAAVPGFFLPFGVLFCVGDCGPPRAPVDFLAGGDWPLGAVFLLPLLVLGASLRWVLSRAFSRPERVLAFAMGLAFIWSSLTLLVNATLIGSNSPRHRLEAGAMALALVASAALLIRNSRAHVPDVLVAIGAMQAPAVVWTLAILVRSASNARLEIGAYFLLLTVVAFLTQIVAVSIAAAARRNRCRAS